MAVWAVKKKNENNEKLMKRLKKQIRDAGFFQVVRNGKYFQKKKTKRRIRAEAIARAKFRSIREKEKLYI